MPFIPCFLCAAKLEKRVDKNGKPYFICNPCGIQLFVRRQHGIKLLERLFRDVERYEISFNQRAQQVSKIQALLIEINGIKDQIDRVKPPTSLLFRDKDKVRVSNLLKIKLEGLFKELEAMSQQKAQ